MLVLVALAFFWVPEADPNTFTVAESARIILFHVPAAIMCVVMFLTGGFFAWRYLRKRNPVDDVRSCAANEIGFLLGIITTLTGMVFASQQWSASQDLGSQLRAAWTWDPRQTTILIQLLIYAAYFALRSSLEDDRQRASFSAGYAVFAALTVPFLVFVIPRLPAIAETSMHGNANQVLMSKDGLDLYYRFALYFAFALYAGLSVTLFKMRTKIGVLEGSIRELADRFNSDHRHRMGWDMVVPKHVEQETEKPAGQS